VDLFAASEQANLARHQPLATRMRPRNLSEFSGQQHFLGPGKLLRRLIDARRLGSLILYGPPGSGKTTLAHLLATETGGNFRPLSAVTSGVKELRELLQWARDEVASGGERPIVFIDEIHRFNRSQQDALLPDVEEGIITLVGATTSNPYFAINGALLSRSQILQFQPLTVEELESLLYRAIADKERGLGRFAIDPEPDAITFLATIVDGDARRALNTLEIAVLSTTERPVHLTVELARESMQQKSMQFDPSGDEHYDLASALIKSIRGSDVDAALYWLARGLESGEDIRFLCRRLVILASEDIGNADPQALVVAVSTMQACEFIGLPECQLTLSQAVIYLALAPKSNSATTAIGLARQDVREGRTIPVPVHLRDSHYGGAKQFGHGNDYQYSHDAPEGIAQQDYLSVDKKYYTPTDRGLELELAKRWAEIRKLLGKPD
jgi:putative ATPase